MNKIKLLSLLIAAATSIAALADGPEYNFTTTDGGSTLVINGKGDLTTYSTSTSAQVFTSTGAANVYADNSGTAVTQGAQYIQNATYYQQVPNYVQKWTAATFPTTQDYTYLSSVTTSGTWNNTACSAENTYVYKINYINTTAEWSVENGTHLYSFNTPVQVWNNTATGAYMYPVTYNASKWASSLDGKYVYKAKIDNNVVKIYDSTNLLNSAPDNDVQLYGDGSNINNWTYYYIYSDSEITGADWQGKVVTIGTDANYVTSDMIEASPNITIGARVTAGNYPDQINTFSYDNNTYFCYVTSTSELMQGTIYDLSSLSSDITLLTSMDNYHELQSSVYLTEIANGAMQPVNTYTFTCNDQTYRCYATSTESLNGQTVALSNLSLLQDEALNSLYTTKNILFLITDRITSGNYTVNSMNIGGTATVGYVVLSSAYDSNNTYYSDGEGITLLTENNIGNYADLSVMYRCYTNLYLSQDNGVTKTQLSADTDYTLTSNDIFYYVDGNSYEAIADNSTFFGTTHTDYIETNTTTLTFKDILLAQILSGSYTKVVFNNTTTDNTPLTINPEIVQIINFPNNSQNTNLTNLDLGQATLKLTGEETFSKIFDKPGADYNYSNTLAEVTLPLVSAVGGEVTLPSNAIPSGYNNANAALITVNVPTGYTKIGSSAFYGNSHITTVNLPEGLTEIGDNAFENCTGLKYINNTASRSIVLPSSLATIGESAFVGTSLTSTEDDPFILPSGLRKIKKSAFQNLTNLEFLQLNEGLEYVGNTAFGLHAATSKQATITFPSTLKYLGPGSFIMRWYQDVYFTGTTAPVCPVGKSAYSDWGNVTAFSVNTQMGNNGFDPIGAKSGSTVAEGSTAGDASTGYANRENYINNSAYYFTILHFPDSLTSDQAKTYRDITRRYVTGTFNATTGAFTYAGYGADIHDATDPNTNATYGSVFKEKVDGNVSSLVYYMSSGGLLNVYTNSAHVQPGFIDTYLGAQQIWPSQSQWIRNFVTVANGVEWDGTTEYRPTVTEKMFDMMKEDGLFVQANSLDYSTKRVADANNSNGYGHDFSLADITWSQLNDGTDEHKRMLDYLSLILHQGTRRFVLSYDGGYSIPFKVKLKGGRWWSICLPFNMTKAEVDRVFGGNNTGTHVCLMSAVDRTVTNNSTDGNTLVLKFKNDVYRHKTERTVIKSNTGYAYTYASNFSKSNEAPADDDIVLYARESYMIYPVREDAGNDPVYYDFGTPVFETGDPLPTMVQANRENEDEPYAISGSDPVYRFIGNFTTATTTDVTVKIPQYSYAFGRASATATDSKFFILSTAGATWSPFKSIVQNTAGGDDDWSSFFGNGTARVNQVSLFGEDEEITGIQNIVIEASSDDDKDLRVFNLNGAQMGNSLQGLPAGTYIQGGKAYRVK